MATYNVADALVRACSRQQPFRLSAARPLGSRSGMRPPQGA